MIRIPKGRAPFLVRNPKKKAGKVRIPKRKSRNGRNSYEKNQQWSKFLREKSRNGQNSYEKKQEWSEFLRKDFYSKQEPDDPPSRVTDGTSESRKTPTIHFHC